MQPQRSDEWYADRLGRATASRVGDVMSVIRSGEAAKRRNYRAELVAERLTGIRIEGFTSSAMQWGIDTEPLARLYYAKHTGEIVQETGFHKLDDLMAGASPDGLINEDGGVEFKCPETATHIETLKTNKVPTMYLWQVDGGLWITGRKWWDFVSFDPRLPENARFIRIRVERNEQRIANLEAGVRQFLAEVDAEEQFVKNYGGQQ